MPSKVIKVDVHWTKTPTLRSVRYCDECKNRINGPSYDFHILSSLTPIGAGRFCQYCFDSAFSDEREKPLDRI